MNKIFIPKPNVLPLIPKKKKDYFFIQSNTTTIVNLFSTKDIQLFYNATSFLTILINKPAVAVLLEGAHTFFTAEH